MALELPRAEDLRIVRAICEFLNSRKGKRASVDELAAWLRTVARLLHHHDWRRSRTYHYTSAACELGLVAKSTIHEFALTQEGEKLARSARVGQAADDELTCAEKAVFRGLLLRCGAAREYLAVFMPDGCPPRTIGQFTGRGQPIRIIGVSRDVFSLVTAQGTTRTITRAEKTTYAWTLYPWLRDLGLADDIYEEAPSSFLDQERPEIRIFYPVRVSRLSVAELRRLILDTVVPGAGGLALVYIPRLLVEVCARRGIPKVLFLATIVELHKTDPIVFYLQMMSFARADSRAQSRSGHCNFPEYQGIHRSHLLVKLGALRTEDHEHVK